MKARKCILIEGKNTRLKYGRSVRILLVMRQNWDSKKMILTTNSGDIHK